ncbi:MAG TPA: hypothetical protein VIJ73_13340 [Methylomirabilota bacterium]
MNTSTEEDTDDDCMVRKGWLPAVPTHLGRALASVRASAARLQGQPKTRRRAALPQMVAPEREWELLRAVEQAARRYRRTQRALAHREALGGEEPTFRTLLDAVALSHHQLDTALLEIQRYYKASGEAESGEADE